jgi:hypothetical protein
MPGEVRMDKHCDKHGSDGKRSRDFLAGLISVERRNEMDLINFIVWLTAGAIIGWFSHRMVTAQRADKPTTSEDGKSGKN